MENETTQWWHGIEQLAPVGLKLLLVFAIGFLLAKWLTRLQSRLRESRTALASIVAWLPVVQIAIWIATLLVAFTVLLEAPRAVIATVLIPSILAAVIASRDLVGNAFAGAALAFEHTILAGDLVDIFTPTGEIVGQVASIGVRRTLIRRPDGSEVVIPNRTLLDSTVRTNHEHERDSAVEIELALAADFSTRDFPRMQRLAQTAAAVSRFASLRRQPEVFLESDGDGTFHLSVQAWAFAPEYVRHLRTDVVAMFNEALEERQDESPTTR
jgi:small-conductance mechanosensitive channel